MPGELGSGGAGGGERMEQIRLAELDVVLVAGARVGTTEGVVRTVLRFQSPFLSVAPACRAAVPRAVYNSGRGPRPFH